MAANLHQKYQGHIFKGNMGFNIFLEAVSGEFSISWFLPSSQESTWTCKGSTAQCFPFGLEANMTTACKRIPFPEARGRVSEKPSPAGRG